MRHKTTWAALSAAVLLGCVPACSSGGQGRDFGVPGALCGVGVPAGPLARLLPASGERLASKSDTASEDRHAGCEVTVDGDRVLSVERERVDAGRSAWNIASYDRRIGHAKTGENATIAYVGRAAVSVVPCTGKDDRDEAVSTYIRTLEPGRQDEAAMKELISGYTAALRSQHPC
ncbi:hypothetical protein [Streptomyces sp. NPDC005573]|uniref:hypothetical protein n=1 Tax=Streptomyces sp. NPDC005573 TaxID=3156890 RepID=UPI0033A3CE92